MIPSVTPSSPSPSVLADKTIRLKRAESPTVAGGTKEIQELTYSLNSKIGEIVDTVKRWYDGDYGTVPSEDRTKAGCYQDFASVALERIPASFLVRVFDRLASGNCEQSAVSCIQGSRREKPGKGPLEEAIEANDEKEIARLRNYLSVVESASSVSGQPLSFIERWREEFTAAFRAVLPPVPRGDPAKTAADKWVDIVVDDAAQYLRHHVKLVQEWQTKEGERVEELKSFSESKMGAAFLEARSKFFPEGIPRNRKLRLALFSNPELCSWRKPKTVFVGGATEAALMEGNPELVLLRDTNTTYRRLSKPFTRPTWTRISTENLRWPFIPTALFDQRQGLSPTKDGFSVCIPVPPTSSNTPASVLRIPLNRTTRLTRRPQGGGPWELEWKDEIAGEIFPVAVKGMRFEHHGGKWTARMTYERQGTPLPSHEQKVIDATYKRISPPLVDGDVLVTFSLEPRTKRDRSGAKRVGWLRVVGMKEGVAKELFATPVDSSQNRSAKRAIRRGKVPFHRNSSPRNFSVRPSAHGPTDGVSFPQIVHLKGEIDREVRFIRAVKDLSQKEETVQWILKMRRNVGSDTRGIAHGERLRKIQDSVERGSPPSNALMGPFRERLKGLREKLAGMKRAYRHGVAKDVLRQVHRIREMTESENRRGIGAFRREYPSGSVFLVIENHKGRGAGPLRQRVTNRALGSLGAAEIYGLIEEKAAFMNRPIPVLAIPPKGIRKDCPSCDHTHAKGQSGPTFSCGGCGHKEFITSVATKNLVRLVLAPKKKVKHEE